MAFVDEFDLAYLLREQLIRVLRTRLPIKMLTDSKTLFDVVTRGTLTTERRLVIDLMAVRESYARGDVSDIGHVRSEHNLADELTKASDCVRLLALMRKSRVNHAVNEWITRSASAIAAANRADAERLSLICKACD